jgi:hypothetical protein
MSTSGNTLWLMEDDFRLSTANTNGFFGDYSRSFIRDVISMLDTYGGVEGIADKMNDSVQLVFDDDNQLFNNPSYIERILGKQPADVVIGEYPEPIAGGFRPKTPSIFEVGAYYALNKLSVVDSVENDYAHEEYLTALGGMKYAHDAALQVESGVFFTNSWTLRDAIGANDAFTLRYITKDIMLNTFNQIIDLVRGTIRFATSQSSFTIDISDLSTRSENEDTLWHKYDEMIHKEMAY